MAHRASTRSVHLVWYSKSRRNAHRLRDQNSICTRDHCNTFT
ncbi:Uncharacterised protein [Vibrio cholerae]|nr:Uncharacterised protein [Vibrio cholerae]CSI56616.1 Uncharacterised protein [Vibrio cholerae]